MSHITGIGWGSDFNKQGRILNLTFSCWVSSILSRNIRPFSSCLTNSCKLKWRRKLSGYLTLVSLNVRGVGLLNKIFFSVNYTFSWHPVNTQSITLSGKSLQTVIEGELFFTLPFTKTFTQHVVIHSTCTCQFLFPNIPHLPFLWVTFFFVFMSFIITLVNIDCLIN